MIHVNFNTDLDLVEDSELFVKAAKTTLQEVDEEREIEVTVVVTDDAQVKDLNRQFREMDIATDVLSFPSEEIDIDTGLPYLGDIIISFPQALQQAARAGHPVEAELQLLAVHGMLHLLGYDHGTEEEKNKMWTKQSRVLEKLGLTGIRILEEQD